MKRAGLIALALIALFFSWWISSHREGQIVVHVDAEEIQLIPGNESGIKVYAENLGPGKADAFVEIHMPILDDAPMDTPDSCALLTYMIQSPWKMTSQRIEGNELVSVYGFGELSAGAETSYLITGWTFSNFRIVNGMCGRYGVEELGEMVRRVRIR